VRKCLATRRLSGSPCFTRLQDATIRLGKKRELR
jgi:hypothetical protein